jgi:tetratricopeptide (TPR) repeat protein
VIHLIGQQTSKDGRSASAAAQAWLLNEAAYRLRALGRLTEAVEPMRVGMDRRVDQQDWTNAAISASNLSELEVTLGRVEEAVADARRSIEFADHSGDAFMRMVNRVTAADALHQSGQQEEARRLFEQAEALQRERQPGFDLLYSLSGFRYCDLILAPAERSAWQRSADTPVRNLETSGGEAAKDEEADKLRSREANVRDPLEALAEAERRAKQTLEWAEQYNLGLLDIALDHLTLARVALYRALLEPLRPSSFEIRHVTAALDGLRKSSALHMLPRALLTAALHAHLRGDAAAASRALAEAQQIAERGPMPLYLADVHLHRARLFRDKAALAKPAPSSKPTTTAAAPKNSPMRKLLQLIGSGLSQEHC